jgi:xylan 1,4-beta-xylosidase
MEMNRELINSKGPLPMRLSELNPPESGKTWREELCLFLVIWGAAEVIVGETRSLLRDEDIIVINPNAVFEIRSTDCGALMLYIGLDALGGADGQPAFDCDSSKAEDKAAFYTLKHLCATFLKENSGGTENNIFFNNALAFSILSELQKFFPVKENTGAAIAAKNADRIKSIINEINAHYREGVTLKDLARSQNFSVPYFSAFFKRCFGVGFTEYYNDFRLERAVSELLSSEQPIENIAHNHGFTDVRSFVALFKKRYGLLPSAYRKEMAPPAGGTEYESGLYTLSKYLPPPQNQLPVSKMPASEEKRADAGKISVLGGTPLKHTFRAFTSVGRAKELLYADVQEMLAEFQNEIGFRYIKFHGILSDDMLLYGENDKGEARYSFVMLDKAIDFLMSIKLKPLVQFSFMPKRLASDKDETLFFSPFNISMPKDLNKWQGLIKAVTEHFIERYGLNAVKQWLFCVWNEPNLIIWTPPPLLRRRHNFRAVQIHAGGC